MNNSKTATQKHMTLDDRISIEKGLDQHLSLRSIALQLGKDPTTISKEIKSTGLSRNTIVLMNLLTNVLWQKIAKRKIFVVPMPLFAKDVQILQSLQLSLRGLYSSILPLQFAG